MRTLFLAPGSALFVVLAAGCSSMSPMSAPMVDNASLPEAVRSIIYGIVLLGAVVMLRDRQSA